MIFFLVIKGGQSGPLFPSTLLPFSALDPFSVSAPGSYHRRYHLLFPSSCFGSHQHHHRLHLFHSSLSAPFLLFLFMIAITTITVHLCSSCLGNHHQLHLILLRSPIVVPSLSLCYLLLLHDSIITVPYCSILLLLWRLFRLLLPGLLPCSVSRCCAAAWCCRRCFCFSNNAGSFSSLQAQRLEVGIY